MRSYEENFKFQAQFVDTIRRIVGPFMLVPSSLEVDQREATDFMMMTGRDLRIAARVRRKEGGYAERYPKDVTIRSRRSNGAKTGWHKVMHEGFADWMFYGHEAGYKLNIYPFYLVDLHVLRDLYRQDENLILAGEHIPNGDGTFFHVIQPVDLCRRYDRRDLIITYEAGFKTDGQLEIFDSARPVNGYPQKNLPSA